METERIHHLHIQRTLIQQIRRARLDVDFRMIHTLHLFAITSFRIKPDPNRKLAEFFEHPYPEGKSQISKVTVSCKTKKRQYTIVPGLRLECPSVVAELPVPKSSKALEVRRHFPAPRGSSAVHHGWATGHSRGAGKTCCATQRLPCKRNNDDIV